MKKFALIIIDMQNDFVKNEQTAVKGAKHTITSIQNTIKACRENGVLIIHVVRAYDENGENAELFRREQFKKGNGLCIKNTKGAEIIEELRPENNDIVLVKPRFSAFFQTSLHEILQQNNITHVLVAGTQYPNCVRATAVDSMCYDYETIVLTDCCSAQHSEIAEYTVIDLQKMGITCQQFDRALLEN